MSNNVMLKDVVINWPKLDAPVSPFGAPQWEIQVELSDDQMKDMTSMGLKVKSADGKNTMSLKRRAVKQDGSANDPVRLVDAQKMPMANRSGIGNGSKGNVIVYVMDYEFAGNKGKTAILTAVQITDLVEYQSSGLDFDMIEDAAGSSDVAF